jgi:hypothetical protein
MRTRWNSTVLRGLVVLAALSPAGLASAGRIDATPGKKYELNKAHGPVMIMVETFRRSANEGSDEKAKTAEQVANELVYELRSKNNLPAYIYHVNADDGLVETIDRTGQRDQRKNLHKVESFGVIAGNYPSLNDPLAKETLAYVKKLKPQCLSPENGIVWYAKPGQGPFQKAFLTVNPLLTQEEADARLAADRKPDTLLIQLNSAVNYSLLENKGKYTLQVAMFTGRTVIDGTMAARKVNFFEERKHDINPLDIAAIDANDLTLALRQHRGREAYVWHDRHHSIVTVGSYMSKEDPQILRDFELFKAKPKLNEVTKVTEVQPEHMWIDNTGPKKDTRRIWAFMPEPLLIPVPKVGSRGGQQLAMPRIPFTSKPGNVAARAAPDLFHHVVMRFREAQSPVRRLGLAIFILHVQTDAHDIAGLERHRLQPPEQRLEHSLPTMGFEDVDALHPPQVAVPPIAPFAGMSELPDDDAIDFCDQIAAPRCVAEDGTNAGEHGGGVERDVLRFGREMAIEQRDHFGILFSRKADVQLRHRNVSGDNPIATAGRTTRSSRTSPCAGCESAVSCWKSTIRDRHRGML